jgi:hypothetical protein
VIVGVQPAVESPSSKAMRCSSSPASQSRQCY